MIDSNIRLNTWVDIQEAFILSKSKSEWPTEVISVTCYWDEILIRYSKGNVDEIIKWVEEMFKPRFTYIDECLQIIMADDISKISVVFMVIDEEDIPNLPTIRPSINISSTTYRQSLSPVLTERNLAVSTIAFHSFKGGVGRTLHAIALAKSLSDRGKSVLLVDGDFEAPGVTYLVKDSINIDYSYADLIASIHSDISEDFENSKLFAGKSLANQKLNNIFLLPSFRTDYHQKHFEIKPEHIIQNISDGFILPDIIAQIGKSLSVDYVIIDLRAGLSELSTGILLDPRVKKYLVSTMNAQSIEGTKLLLEVVKEFSNSLNYSLPQMNIILNNISEFYISNRNILDEIKNELSDKYFGEINEVNSDNLYDIEFIESHFNQELLYLSNNFNDYFTKIEKAGIDEHFKEFFLEDVARVPVTDLDTKRKLLSTKAEDMIYAERGTVENILWTQPLARLAESFLNKVPNVVISGAKGAGKTLIFTYLIKSRNWENFLSKGKYSCDINAIILPVLKPSSLSEQALEDYETLKDEIADYLEIPKFNVDVRDYIESHFTETLTIQQWTKIWINAIAISCNFRSSNSDLENIGEEFLLFLRQSDKKVVALIDGLEDLFQNISATQLMYQKDVISALLQRVPDYLSQQPGLPLGIIILIRQDYIEYSISQNSAQFIDRYKKFQLRWNVDEALKLALHVSSDVLDGYTGHDRSREDIIKSLIPLWGNKLGNDNSREAYSANWILTALSDWKGQIQARDIIRFLYEAASSSIQHPSSDDRILAVTAVKSAVSKCSISKISEIGQENLVLKGIFENLINITDKKTPFLTTELPELNQQDLKILVDNGILYKEVSKHEQEQYHIAEIYLQGLGFSYKGRKMTKMLAFRRAIES